MLAPTIAMAVLMGVLPGIFLKPMEPSVLRVIDRVNGSQPARVDNRSLVPAPSPATASAEPRRFDDTGRPEPIAGRPANSELRAR
jgi:hypothetical protein